jgi:dihydropteroate synthase
MAKKTDVLLTGTVRQLSIAAEKLKKQPFGLKQLASDLEHAIDSVSRPKTRTLACGRKKLKLGEKTLVMGILNITPDSFSDGGKFFKPAIAVKHAVQMEKDGADIIDIGGESTKPGAKPVSQKEEELSGKLKIPISVDTRKPEVARKAVDLGAGMVNVVGGVRSSAMADAIAELGVPAVLMHMQGEPGTMQKKPKYKDVMDDIVDELACQIALCLEHGVKKSQLIVDPGIGFGKTVENNLELISRLGELKILDAPIMIGTSRKSFIGKVLGVETDDRLAGSLASAVLAAVEGADIVRVHDVKETKRALAIADSINQSAYQKY